MSPRKTKLKDWPINYEDIQKYYDIDQQITGVSGQEGDPFYKGIKDLMPPVPLGPMGKKISAGFKKLGWHHWPAYSAINTIPIIQDRQIIILGLQICMIQLEQRVLQIKLIYH